MMQKRLMAALTLLMLMVASASADKQGRTALAFGDWLGKQVKSTAASKAGPSFVAPAYDYGGVEVHHTCLEVLGQQNCRTGEQVVYLETVLGCCGEKNHGNELVLKPTTIGHCDFTVFVILGGVPQGPNIEKSATFFALCYFEKKADECGEPFGDKVVLNVQGDYYGIIDAILSSDPGQSPSQCSSRRKAGGNVTEHMSDMLFPRLAVKHASRSSPKVTAKAAYEPDQEGYRQYEGVDNHHSSRTLYKTESAGVFYGPFTVNSRLHSIKYDQGWMQVVLEYAANPIPVTEDEAGDAHVLDPYKYKLSFFKKQAY